MSAHKLLPRRKISAQIGDVKQIATKAVRAKVKTIAIDTMTQTNGIKNVYVRSQQKNSKRWYETN